MTDQKTRGDKSPDAGKAAFSENTEAQPKQTVGALVAKLLADPALGYEKIVSRVRTEFPTAQTSARSVASTASVLRRNGHSIPIRRRVAKAK